MTDTNNQRVTQLELFDWFEHGEPECSPDKPKKEAKPIQQSPGSKWIAAYRYGIWDI